MCCVSIRHPLRGYLTVWRKRKRGEEEHARVQHQEEEWKNEKLEKLCDRNHLAQQKRRKKLKTQEIEAGIQNKDGKKLPVSQVFSLRIVKLKCMKMVRATELELPSRAEVAAASHPKKAIVAEMKQREKEKAGKVYVPSKHDAAPYKNVNWMSPTFWPIIETAA